MCQRNVILLVDDDAETREAIALLIESECSCGGCTVMQASDGRAGLVLARTRRPDVIVSDVEMPLMDGMELLAQLRGDDDLHDVPVVLLSGRADLASVARAGGADAHVSKPVDFDELLAAVATLPRACDAGHRL